MYRGEKMMKKRIGIISVIILLLINLTVLGTNNVDNDNHILIVAENRDEDIPIVG